VCRNVKPSTYCFPGVTCASDGISVYECSWETKVPVQDCRAGAIPSGSCLGSRTRRSCSTCAGTSGPLPASFPVTPLLAAGPPSTSARRTCAGTSSHPPLLSRGRPHSRRVFRLRVLAGEEDTSPGLPGWGDAFGEELGSRTRRAGSSCAGASSPPSTLSPMTALLASGFPLYEYVQVTRFRIHACGNVKPSNYFLPGVTPRFAAGSPLTSTCR
jgi:hypothetical protein